MNSLPKTVTRQRRDCDLNPGPSAPESRTLTTRLPRATLPVGMVGQYQGPTTIFKVHSALVLTDRQHG